MPISVPRADAGTYVSIWMLSVHTGRLHLRSAPTDWSVVTYKLCSGEMAKLSPVTGNR